MSNLIFPSLSGMSIEMTRTPTHNTIRKKSTNGTEVRASLMVYPLYDFKISFNYLLDTQKQQDYQTLQGFYNQVHGSFDNFLFLHKRDNSAYRQNFAMGDGITSTFRLGRTLGGFMEPLYGVNKDSVAVYLNGNEVTNFTSYTDGYVTFITPPSRGTVISWSGIYYFRCIFDEDTIDFTRIYSDVWSSSDIKLHTVKEGG